MPSVSVVIPSFNRGHCIRACLESVLDQTFQDIEAIIVDDGSKDNTKEQVLSLRDPRVRYIKHDANRGGAAARNTGIQASRSEFLAFLDSDDRWVPDKLEKQIRLMRAKGPEYGFSYTWLIWQNPAGEEVLRMSRTVDGLATVDLLVENCIGTFSSVLARRVLLGDVGGLDERMKSCQDWDLFVRLNAITKVCCVQEYLVLYQQNRDDRNRISANPTSVVQGHRRMLQKMESRFTDMSSDTRVASLKAFANAFASAGAISDALRIGFSIVGIAPSFKNILLLTRIFARVIKRNVTQDFGY